MGPKISVDSATLMNKGLEVIEAHHLFGVPATASRCWCTRRAWCIRWSNSSTARTLAQLGLPDMRTALAVRLGLARAHRLGRRPGWTCCRTAASISSRPTCDAFPCLRLAFEALRAGGTAPAVLNAANEVAVSAFLQRPDRLSWRYPRWSRTPSPRCPPRPADSLDGAARRRRARAPARTPQRAIDHARTH